MDEIGIIIMAGTRAFRLLSHASHDMRSMHENLQVVATG